MPTELRWIPSANNLNNLNTDRSVLSFILEIGGEVVQKDRIFFEANASAEEIVTELFLYSGFDLMRQRGMRDYFTYSPRLDFQDILNPGTEIRITGYGADTQPEENYAFERHSINLKLVPMNAFSLEDEPSDKSTWFDYVQQQFGGAHTIHSCGTMYNMGG